MSLEDLLRKSIRSGFLHISLNRRWDDPETWEAGYRNTDNSNVRYVRDRDPVEAMSKAIKLGIGDATLPPSKPEKKTRRRERRHQEDDLI